MKKKRLFCNDIAQIIREICGISRKQIFNIKKHLNWVRKSIYLDNFEQRSLTQLMLNFFVGHYHNSWLWIWYWQNAYNYRTFQLWVRAQCINVAKSLDFVISGAIRKCKRIKNLMLILCLPPAILLKTTLANFADFFSR